MTGNLILKSGGSAARLWAFPVSIAIHAMIITSLLILPLLNQRDLPRLVFKTEAFLAPLPRLAPPPPAKKHRATRPGRLASNRAVRTLELGKLIAPVQIPDEIAEEDLDGIGVEGGMEGGIEGGVPDGTLSAVFGDILASALHIEGNPVRAIGDIRKPACLKQVAPEYPEIARQARVEGIVIIEAATDIYGRVQDMKILRSIPLLDQAALDAVRQWIYEPMIVNGRPRGVIFTVSVIFTLK